MTVQGADSPGVAVPLVEGLTDEQAAALAQACTPLHFAAGEEIFGAGAHAPGIYFIDSGEVEVLAPSAGLGPAACVAVLGPGQAFGELSTLNDGDTITAVRAATAVVVRRLSPAAFERLQRGHDVVRALMRNVIRINQQRMSAVHADYVRQMERTVELLQLRNASARMFILVIFLMCVTILVNHWLKLRPGIDVYSPAFAWAALVVIVLPTAAMAWHERYPLSAMGITRRALGPDLAASAAIVVVVLALGAGALHLAGYPLAERISAGYVLTYGPTYALHSALQEFLGRGVLLGMMWRIFGDQTPGQRQFANVSVSLMFGLMHIHFGLAAVALTMVFSLLLGSYYMIHRNLAGPVLIHVVLGLAAFMFGLI